MTILVFVYGSLKQGFSNHGCLKGADFYKEAKIKDAVMYDLGPFPGVVDGEGEVKGELYRATEAVMARLDRLEGHPNFYCRKKVPIVGEDYVAWTYFLSDRTIQGLTEKYKQIVPDGDWKPASA